MLYDGGLLNFFFGFRGSIDRRGWLGGIFITYASMWVLLFMFAATSGTSLGLESRGADLPIFTALRDGVDRYLYATIVGHWTVPFAILNSINELVGADVTFGLTNVLSKKLSVVVQFLGADPWRDIDVMPAALSVLFALISFSVGGMLFRPDWSLLMNITQIIAFWCVISLGVKRLHDLKRSGAYILFAATPVIGPLLLFAVLCLVPSKKDTSL